MSSEEELHASMVHAIISSKVLSTHTAWLASQPARLLPASPRCAGHDVMHVPTCACVGHARVELPAGATHQIVRDYLVHYGYADTLAAFDSAAGAIPGASDDDMGQDGCVLRRRAYSHGGSICDSAFTKGAGPTECEGREIVCQRTSSPLRSAASRPDVGDMALRRDVRQRIVAGDVEAAQQLLQQRRPQLLAIPAAQRPEQPGFGSGYGASSSLVADPADGVRLDEEASSRGEDMEDGEPARHSGAGSRPSSAEHLSLTFCLLHGQPRPEPSVWSEQLHNSEGAIVADASGHVHLLLHGR